MKDEVTDNIIFFSPRCPQCHELQTFQTHLIGFTLCIILLFFLYIGYFLLNMFLLKIDFVTAISGKPVFFLIFIKINHNY